MRLFRKVQIPFQLRSRGHKPQLWVHFSLLQTRNIIRIKTPRCGRPNIVRCFVWEKDLP